MDEFCKDNSNDHLSCIGKDCEHCLPCSFCKEGTENIFYYGPKTWQGIGRFQAKSLCDMCGYSGRMFKQGHGKELVGLKGIIGE